jgi:hypothetical protein
MTTIKTHHRKGRGKGRGRGRGRGRGTRTRRGTRRGTRNSRPGKSRRSRTGSRVKGGADKKLIILFKSKGCVHCKNILEAWNELKATPDRDISYKTLESTDADFQGVKDRGRVRSQHKGGGLPAYCQDRTRHGPRTRGRKEQVRHAQMV